MDLQVSNTLILSAIERGPGTFQAVNNSGRLAPTSANIGASPHWAWPYTMPLALAAFCGLTCKLFNLDPGPPSMSPLVLKLNLVKWKKGHAGSRGL